MKRTKKDQLELSARDLFWKYGFKKVSIDEICTHAAVSRKTFYTLYDNKQALVVEILNKVMDDAFQLYDQMMHDDLPFQEKINRMFNFKYEMAGKFSMEFISDFHHPDSAELLQLLTGITQRAMDMMRGMFSDAQKKGELNPDLNLNYVMWLMQKWTELYSSEELMAFFPDTDSMTRQVSHTIMYGLINVPESTLTKRP